MTHVIAAAAGGMGVWGAEWLIPRPSEKKANAEIAGMVAVAIEQLDKSQRASTAARKKVEMLERLLIDSPHAQVKELVRPYLELLEKKSDPDAATRHLVFLGAVLTRVIAAGMTGEFKETLDQSMALLEDARKEEEQAAAAVVHASRSLKLLYDALEGRLSFGAPIERAD